MKAFFKFTLLAATALLMFVADLSLQPGSKVPAGMQLMSEAHAIAGRQRRTRRRGAAVGYEAGASSAHAQDAAAAQQQPAQQSADQQQQQSAPPPPQYGPLPEGTVVQQLPGDCQTQASGGVEYYHCGDNTFRSAFQGNQLVYVTVKPAQSQ